jgi:hypothetical protein
MRDTCLTDPVVTDLVTLATSGGTARSKARMVLDISKTGVVGSNPLRGVDVCPHIIVLC